jgi:hypothetical protein
MLTSTLFVNVWCVLKGLCSEKDFAFLALYADLGLSKRILIIEGHKLCNSIGQTFTLAATPPPPPGGLNCFQNPHL